MKEFWGAAVTMLDCTLKRLLRGQIACRAITTIKEHLKNERACNKNQYQYRKLKSSVRWAAAVSRVRSKPRLLGHGFFHQFTLDETGLKYILSLQFFISNLP